MAGDFRKPGDGRDEAATARGWMIGKPHRKVDAVERMRGVMRYTDDLKLPGMLHGKILRSPHAHARIKRIDASRALAMRGVFGVVTGRDFPIPYGVIPWTPDENALCVDKALHVGDGVAAVAAIDEDTAIAACAAIEIDYEPLPAIFDPEVSLASKDGEAINPYSKHGNLSKHVHLDFGDVEAGLDAADVVVEDEYFFEGTTHTAIEPHCALANLEPGGVLTVWSATQVSHYLHRELAKVLEVPASRIRVIQPPIGGAFGGKSEPFDLEFCVAKLAMMTGRPVKILYTREEAFYSHRGRHPMRMRYKTGFSADGRITAVDAHTLIDGGAYSSFGLVTTYYSGQLLCAPYRFPSYRFDSWRAYTNKPACGPKRGHGSVQPRFAIECQLDKAAAALGIDPIELRRRNDLGGDSVTVNEMRVGSNGFLECLEKVEAASGWKQRYGKLAYGRGLGVAGSTYISGTNYCIYPSKMPQAAVQVTLDRSGRARVFSGANDIGQGSNTMLAVIVAEELGLELADIRVLSADSDLCPVDLGAYSSRITLMVGNACLLAARELAGKVRRSVAAAWDVPLRRVTLVAGRAQDLRGPGARRDPGRGIPDRRVGARPARRGRQLRHAARPPRRVPGRHHRRVAGLQLHRAHRRGRRRSGDRRHPGDEGVGRARLRQGAVAAHRRGTDRGQRVHGLRRGDHGGAHDRRAPRRRARGAQPARLPHPDLPGHAGDRGHDRRGGRRPGAVRGQGGRRGAAPPDHPGHLERDLRRGRRAHERDAVLSRAGAGRHRGAARAGGQGDAAAAQARRRRRHRRRGAGIATC